MAPTVPRGWRIFFWLAAAFNFLIGIGSFLEATWGSDQSIGAVLIIGFGIIYALVARDPVRFGATLIAGLFGKGMVVAMLGPTHWFGGGDPALGAIVAGDLLFAIGFAIFLLQRRSHG
ncbi:hypothetical protein [Qipengyuania flava]|uniref:hypothetical protein n=1 Tax=Qipengyuania flava TaxID=192812 RepID=UPI001C639EF6|nr:hypothetical protein [Qipengyuania flava]QYJ07013.1 hypothetical protein KUV82_13370 [Qipengyuania flava]